MAKYLTALILFGILGCSQAHTPSSQPIDYEPSLGDEIMIVFDVLRSVHDRYELEYDHRKLEETERHGNINQYNEKLLTIILSFRTKQEGFSTVKVRFSSGRVETFNVLCRYEALSFN